MNVSISQISLLKNNYNNNHSKEVVAQCQETGITIELHNRDMGREAFYAVKSGEPIAYCVGHRLHRKSGQWFCIKSTFVHPDHQKQGIGMMVYAAILDSGRTVISDYDLSEGAVALWTKLRAHNGYRVRKKWRQYIARAVPGAR